MSPNDRGFLVFTFNPITGFKPEFIDVSIINVYTDIKWYAPQTKVWTLACGAY